MMIDIENNLCAGVISDMESMGFKQSSINFVKGSSQFIDGYDKNEALQRTMLTMLFYTIMISGTHTAPAHVRIALNAATDVVGWWDDMRLVILPFLKANEDLFFFM